MSEVQHNARGAATRQMLLESALSLLSRYGYDSTSIAKLESATNRPASSIYWLFKNKDALIIEALETAYEQQPTRWERWEESAGPENFRNKLAANLTPDFQTSELKAPVRLGILLSLEGAADKEEIRKPYKYRRGVAFKGFSRWWLSALRNNAADNENSEMSRAAWLSALTVMFLDGHYISDDNISEATAARNAATVAEILGSLSEASAEEIDAVPKPVRPANEEVRPQEAIIKDSVEGRLLQATRHLVAKHGYEGATLARILKLSRVKKSSVYWRYEDKDALVCAAVAQPFLDNLAPFKKLTVGSEDWDAKLTQAFLEFLDNVEKHPIAVKAGLLLKLLRWDKPATASVALNAGTTEVGEHLVTWFKGILPESEHQERNARDIAWAIARLCDGIMYHYSSEHEYEVDIPLRSLIPSIVIGLKRAIEHQNK